MTPAELRITNYELRTKNRPRFLVKHLGNMGDHIFLIPPVLATLKKVYPNCHITLVTAWGYKETIREWPYFSKKQKWGSRNQGGFCIHLMMTNPHVDQLVHWHDIKLSLTGNICYEEQKSFPTWNKKYFLQQKNSGNYDAVYELDFGLGYEDNPLQKIYEAIGLADEHYSNYKIYLTENDKKVAADVMKGKKHPRIILLEGIDGPTTRGWDPAKVKQLENRIKEVYGVSPLWFGGRFVPEYNGHSLTLRENIATLALCDVAIGVMSGPLHFAAAVGLPTITLYCDQPLQRAAPAFFLNAYAKENKKHRTILGPSPDQISFLKNPKMPEILTTAEQQQQGYKTWQSPGKQATKSCLAPISVDEVMQVLSDTLGNN